MFKVLGLILWWTFLKGADMLVESLYEAVPLWLRIGVVAALGVGAIPLMFSREIEEWRSRKPPPDSLPELPEDKDLILDDREAVRRNSGNGEAAARLIVRVQIFEKAVSIFNDFKLAPRRIAEVRPYVAMYNRLHTEGMTLATVEYLKCENDEDDYEWVITEMIDEAAEEVPELPAILERKVIEELNALRHPKDEDQT